MVNILIKAVKNRRKCSHKNALIHNDCGYCPDCGQYLVKNYYILRCAHCDVKREAKLFWGEIVPVKKYCTNCGSEEYYIEKLDKITFIDAQYAVYLKEIADSMQVLHPEIQIWVEEEKDKIKQLTSTKSQPSA